MHRNRRQHRGSITGLIVDFDPQHPNHTWAEITDNGYIGNHNPNGDTLYIVDISVRPSYRQLGLGKHLMQSMYELVIHKKLKRLLGGGRMSGYHQVATEMSAEDYLQAVVSGQLNRSRHHFPATLWTHSVRKSYPTIWMTKNLAITQH